MNNDLANELMDESSSFFVSIHDFIRESTSSFNKTNNKSTIETVTLTGNVGTTYTTQQKDFSSNDLGFNKVVGAT